MAEVAEKVPFNMATGELMKPEEIQAKKEAETKPAEEKPKEEVKPEAKTEEKPEVQKATKEEAKAAGTTPDAVQAFFESEMATKYGVKTKEELFEIMEGITSLKEERDQLKGRPTEPVFKNDREKNVYNFLQEYGNMEDGLEMVAKLGAVDPANMDGEKALRLAFILENKDYTAEQAGRVFDKEELKRYQNPKKKEDYDDPIEFDEDNEILKIKKERDINKARRTLIESKEKFKAQAKEAKDRKPEKEEPIIPPQTIARYTKDVDKFFQGFNTLKFSEDDGSNEVSIKFTEDQLKELKNAAYAHLKNPSVYEGGEIKDFDLVHLTNTFAWALYNRQMADLMLKQVKTIAHVTKAEEIAQKQPDKTSGTDHGDGTIDKSFWGQAEAAAKKKAEERKAQGPMKRSPLPAG